MDYEGKLLFMPYLLAIAEFVTKLHAICTKSGMLASYSKRVIDSDSQVLVGEYDAYEPRHDIVLLRSGQRSKQQKDY